MCSKTPNYLQRKLNLKTFLLVLATTLFLSACGIKGDLYQTPKQAPEQADRSNDTQLQSTDETGAPESTDKLAPEQGKEQQ